MRTEKVDVLIIGAGLTGLTAAYYLKKYGKTVKVIEKNKAIGGVIQTHREDDFVFESGHNTGVLSTPEAAELLQEVKELCTPEIADETAKRRWVWKGKSWKELPSGLMGGITTPLFTVKDKFRILAEPFRKRGKNPDETLDHLVRRRMGKSFLEYAVDPFILGIYAGDPSYLVPRYALPKLYNLEQDYGSFIGGAIKKSKEPKTANEKKATKDVFSVKGGLDNLTDALAQKTGKKKIVLGNEHLRVAKTAGGYLAHYDGDKVEASHVVFTGGSHALHGIFDFIAEDDIKKVDNLLYAKVVQVALGFRQWNGRPLNAFGGLVPFREQRDVLGVLLPSAFLKNRAPQGGAMLSVFLGGVRRPHEAEKSDEELLEMTGKEVKFMMQMPDFNPDLVRIFRYRHAIPQYGKTSGERLKKITELEKKNPGLTLAGNMKDGIGMADRIKQGRQVAEKINGESTE